LALAIRIVFKMFRKVPVNIGFTAWKVELTDYLRMGIEDPGTECGSRVQFTIMTALEPFALRGL
jgi:hypothetical protein